VAPHHPADEQQLPKELPKHVVPAVPAQVPSVLTFFVPVEAGAEVDAVAEAVAEVAVPAPPAERYQLAAGSPRHSPTVTALYPRVVRVESM
jgi:hypothetical protein